MTVYTFDNGAVTPAIKAAVNEAWKDSGGSIWLNPLSKSKSVRKFGRHPDLGTTPELIWSHGPDSGMETLLDSNGITTIVSSDVADDQIVSIEYHTISGVDLTFGVQTATLNGRTPVTLATPCARVSRVRNIDTTELEGDIYVYEGGAITNGVPNDASEVHARVGGAESPSLQQTEKAATSISSVDYWFISYMTGNLLGSNTARVRLNLETRSTTGVWLPTGVTLGLGNAGNTHAEVGIDPVLIVPSNYDVRVVGVASTGGTDVGVAFGGPLATVS